MECKICGTKFDNNFGGQLTIHLKKIHNLSMEKYVIITEYDGIDPVCQCGLCEEIPLFYRGRFKKYAKFHDRFDFKQKMYIEKYGEPTCKMCKNIVSFYRGVPRTYCSNICASKDIGYFLQPGAQDVIKKLIQQKYGVDNISKLPTVAKKISISNKGKSFIVKDPVAKSIKLSEAAKKNWQNNSFRKRISMAIKKAVNKPHIRARRSLLMKKRIKSNSYVLKGFKRGVYPQSILHIKIREELKLDELGFKSEQRIDRYYADELCEHKKIIVEINGDYIHANPSKYRPDDIIVAYGNSYLAKEKWESDKLRTEHLNKLGYKVFVIWQSDNLQEKKRELLQLLNGTMN